MAAKHISLGDPAHEAERQAIRFLVEGLPASYTVYSNAWLVERSGASYELDAVVVAPHAIYIVEIKSYRGVIEGNDFDWYVPEPMRSPLRLNYKTAQVLSSALKLKTAYAGRVWVEGFVFLSHARKILVTGHASAARLHGRDAIRAALTDAHALYSRIPDSRQVHVDEHIRRTVDEILRGADRHMRPKRRIREYILESTVDRTDRYVEHLVRHDVGGFHRLLRVYHHAPLAEEAERQRSRQRWQWEAQVLTAVGGHPNIQSADPPFQDEAGLCLPFEYFRGLTLPSWIERHRKKPGKASVSTAVTLWRKMAKAIGWAHGRGAIHRLLRPEVVLVQDTADDPDVRVGGFDLAKRPKSGHTILISTIRDDRLVYAAPEVIRDFSSAEHRSDQFGLGLLLWLLLAGKLPFDSTTDYARRRSLISSLHDVNPYVPGRLDEAARRMLAYRVEDRFATLDEAIEAVEAAVGQRQRERATAGPGRERFDPDDIPKNTRLGTDYEIVVKLGEGGLSTVYAARHLVSGTTRALKVARADEDAEEALRQEYRALITLEHPNVVKAGDLTHAVPERLTMVMERVGGRPLSRWIVDEREPEPSTLRALAEDLLGALVYLEEKQVVHKDLKPDNLIVGEGRLTVIDFSLVALPAESPLGGTPPYMDPASDRWSLATDRFAAAICLFELYTGRHPFDGEAIHPGDDPSIDDSEFDAPGLGDFFRKALDPVPVNRYPSAVALRAAFRDALGSGVVEDEEGRSSQTSPDLDPSTPLTMTNLSEMAVKTLRQAGVYTQGDLVALEPDRIRRLPRVGKKRARKILTFRRKLTERGVEPTAESATGPMPLLEKLVGDESPIGRLGLATKLADALVASGLTTVGKVAAATAESLREMTGVGPKRLPQVVEALATFSERRDDVTPATTVGELLERVLSPLSWRQRQITEQLLCHAPGEAAPSQKTIAQDVGVTQPTVSVEMGRGLEVIDSDALVDLLELLEVILDTAGGLERLDRVLAVLAEHWEIDESAAAMGLLHLAEKVHATRLSLLDGLQGLPAASMGTLIARPWLTAKVVAEYLREADRIARLWPPMPPETARRTLRGVLPEYELDHVALAERLCDTVHILPGGGLVVTPVDAKQAIPYVLRDARLPLELDELRQLVEETFGEAAIWPEAEALAQILAGVTHCRVEGTTIQPVATGSIRSEEGPTDPPPPELLQAERSPEAIVGDLLRGAERSTGYRLVVTPPQRHAEVGRSLAAALGGEARFVSLESRLLERMDAEGDFDEYEDAELFDDRIVLTEAAEETMREVFEAEGAPGRSIVLGDTAILEICDALHLVRTLYDETMSGSRGFWVLVIPGVIRQRQPLFNERASVFHLDGATLPLSNPIPVAEE